MHSAVRPASADLAAADPDGDRAGSSGRDGIRTLTPIKRIVYIIKENRTFDHMFGRFRGASGVTVGMDRGVERPFTPATRGALPADIQHCYD